MKKDSPKHDPARTTAGRGADARGDTATGADAVGPTRPSAGSDDVGGAPSTTDAGLSERLGGRARNAGKSMDRDQVRQHSEHDAPPQRAGQPHAAGEPGAEAADEGPLESLGKAISAPVLGSPPEEKGEPEAPDRRRDGTQR